MPRGPRPARLVSGSALCLALGRSAMSASRETLLSLNFNQDHGCFACGTDAGFRIYNCDPFKETFRRRFDERGGGEGGVGVVEMLFRCNILALVGGGKAPRYSPCKVMIWDDHQSRCIGELSFRVPVRGVRLRRDKIVVVLEHKIYVYNFADLKILHQTDTVANPKGLCALSPAQGDAVMACPGLNRGQVRVEHYDRNVTKFIAAHDGDLAELALSLDGRMLATASEKGTLVRVYDAREATLLHEFRRGADRATIYSIAFSPSKEYLACTSDKGTMHLHRIRRPHRRPPRRDPREATATAAAAAAWSAPPLGVSGSGGGGSGVASGARSSGGGDSGPGSDPSSSARGPGAEAASAAFSFVKGLLPKYFSSEWSLAQFKLPEFTRAIVAFGSEPNELVIATAEGTYYKVAFDPREGARASSSARLRGS